MISPSLADHVTIELKDLDELNNTYSQTPMVAVHSACSVTPQNYQNTDPMKGTYTSEAWRDEDGSTSQFSIMSTKRRNPVEILTRPRRLYRSTSIPIEIESSACNEQSKYLAETESNSHVCSATEDIFFVDVPNSIENFSAKHYAQTDVYFKAMSYFFGENLSTQKSITETKIDCKPNQTSDLNAKDVFGTNVIGKLYESICHLKDEVTVPARDHDWKPTTTQRNSSEVYFTSPMIGLFFERETDDRCSQIVTHINNTNISRNRVEKEPFFIENLDVANNAAMTTPIGHNLNTSYLSSELIFSPINSTTNNNTTDADIQITTSSDSADLNVVEEKHHRGWDNNDDCGADSPIPSVSNVRKEHRPKIYATPQVSSQKPRSQHNDVWYALSCLPVHEACCTVCCFLCCPKQAVKAFAFWPPTPPTYSFIAQIYPSVTFDVPRTSDMTQTDATDSTESPKISEPSEIVTTVRDPKEVILVSVDRNIRYVMTAVDPTAHLTPGRQDCIEPFFTKTARGNIIACALIHCSRQSNPPHFTIFFSHSNAVDIGRLTKFLKFLGTQLHCNVFCYDYSGYGISSGTSSELDLLADGDSAFNELLVRYNLDADRVILFGRSLGTIPTVDLATRYSVAGVVLDSAIASGLRTVSSCVKKTYCCDVLVTTDKMSKILSPTLIIHGTVDNLTTIKQANILHKNCPVAVEPLWLAGVEHIKTHLCPQYYSRLHRFINVDLLNRTITKKENMQFGWNSFIKLDRIVNKWGDSHVLSSTVPPRVL